MTDGVRETLTHFLGPQPSSVLECGCGTWLARHHPVRALAEALPFPAAAFDRVFCVDTLPQVSDRARFFAEARRVLKPGGGLLTIGRDPHTDQDDWWPEQYFDEVRGIDRERFARVRTLRGELALAGFAWTESMEADRLESVRSASEALADPALAAQLPGLSAAALAAGMARLRLANDAAGGELQLVADVRLFATVGWV